MNKWVNTFLKTAEMVSLTSFTVCEIVVLRGKSTAIGDIDGIVEWCPRLKPETRVMLLTGMKRWEILARFHPDHGEGAELFAALGKFEDAAERLIEFDGKLNEELRKRLHSYQLMVRSQEEVKRRRWESDVSGITHASCHWQISMTIKLLQDSWKSARI